MAQFWGRHQNPDFKVDALLTDRRVDLIEEGVDLAVLIGALPESGLVARKLATARLLVTGSPAYLARSGAPLTPADLTTHNCLSYTCAGGGDEWRLTDAHGIDHVVKVGGNLRASSGDMVKWAALGCSAGSWAEWG